MAFTSCHKPDIRERIDNIEYLLEINDYLQARKQCSEVYDVILGAPQEERTANLLRLAMAYMILADNDGSVSYDEDIAMATGLFREAVSQSPDSDTALDLKLSADNVATFELLQQLSAIDSTNNIFVSEDEYPIDSLLSIN